jgi:hypothetical protein
MIMIRAIKKSLYIRSYQKNMIQKILKRANLNVSNAILIATATAGDFHKNTVKSKVFP